MAQAKAWMSMSGTREVIIPTTSGRLEDLLSFRHAIGSIVVRLRRPRRSYSP
jgi:hypothetical protein